MTLHLADLPIELQEQLGFKPELSVKREGLRHLQLGKVLKALDVFQDDRQSGILRGETMSQPSEIGESISGAIFSEDRRFRFAIWRLWDQHLPAMFYIGLNPSTAAEYRNDPTILRLAGLAKTLGFGGLFGANMYPYITAYPAQLWPHEAEQQEMNNRVILMIRGITKTAVVGWGNEGTHAGNRPSEVLKLLGEPVYCFKVNKSGEPIHPLYLPRTSRLIPYIRKGA